MELVSLHTLARTEEGRPLWLTYKLLCHQGRYGILCYLEGVDPVRHPYSTAAIEDLCSSRREAERLLRRLAQRAVTPQHLPDLIWEM